MDADLEISDGPPLRSEPDALVRRLLSGARELERRLDHGFADNGLNLTRADVLDCVHAHGEQGCAQTDLAASLRLSESNICTLIERMRSDGWLFRMRSATDRRRSVVVLSPRGAEVASQLHQLRASNAERWLAGLTGGELHDLNQLLDRLLSVLRVSPPSGAGAPADRNAVVPITAAPALRRAS
ncbi:MAG: MarR family transcriptional regulator [Planctomyces sp.]|nr:MarR family transcriptional regulator [Planctomyces sp.]